MAVAGVVAVGVALLVRMPTPAPSGEPPPPDASDTWGPLAVVPPQQDVMDALTEGWLQVTEACVFLLNESGERQLMVWSAGGTSWDPRDRTITLSGGRELHAGQKGSFSGGHIGAGDPAWVDRFAWVAPPAPACLTNAGVWMVAGGFQPGRDVRIPVPDVTGLTIEEANARLRSVGFEGSVSHGTYGSDPSGPDAIVVAHEPGAGSLVRPGAAVGFRTAIVSTELCAVLTALPPRSGDAHDLANTPGFWEVIARAEPVAPPYLAVAIQTLLDHHAGGGALDEGPPLALDKIAVAHDGCFVERP